MHRPYIWLETWRHRQRDVLALDKKMWDALICFSQEQEIRRNYIKYHIDKSVNSPLFIMRGESGETISHIVSKYSKVTQMNYKWRHDNVARTFHWKLCEKFSLEKLGKLHLHNPQTVTENVNQKLLWDMKIERISKQFFLDHSSLSTFLDDRFTTFLHDSPLSRLFNYDLFKDSDLYIISLPQYMHIFMV